jgi:hypothetical protein
MILIHPSSLAKIMTEPKKKDEVLSAGAKTYLVGLAKEIVYGYRPTITSKYMSKGTQCEQDSIDLYNNVFFTSHVKNEERISTDILSGEADIVDDDLIIDIKTSWSLETFPATKEDAHSSDYEWQGRAYMLLWDKPRFELAFCMVSTPEEFLKYEDASLHLVDHIAPEMRVTTVQYERDAEIEAKIIAKCKAAQEFVERTIETIRTEHQYN